VNATPSHRTVPEAVRRSAARLMAVQAVYQIMTGEEDQIPEMVVEEYLLHRAGMELEGEVMAAPDPDLFKSLVTGVMAEKAGIEKAIDAVRSPKAGGEDHTPLEPLLKAIVLCGAYELASDKKTDFPILLSDYVDVAKAFFGGREPALVNALLDSIRKTVRA